MNKNRSAFGRWLQLLGVTLVLAGAIIGCADGDLIDARLDSAEPPAEQQLSEEEEWLRKQQMIRFTEVNASGTVVSQSESTPSPSHLRVWFLPICRAMFPFPNASTSSCEATTLGMLDNLCYARTFLALASAQAEPVRLKLGNGNTMIVDRVTDEAAAPLALAAAEDAAVALGGALELIRTPLPECRNTSGVWSKISGSSAALFFGRTAGEAYHLGLSAYERAVEVTLNASDKLRSSSLSPLLAAQRAISGPALSRAAAAHILVGGDAGLLGDTLKPLCTSPDLTPQARSALKLLRDAAADPALLTTTNIHNLLDGTYPDGTVRQRLGQFRGIPSLTSGAPVAEHYDLSPADFDAARRYLLEEIYAFSRTVTAKLPAPVTDGYPRYAGVATEPAPLPTGAWAARASYRTIEPDFSWITASDLRQFIATSHVEIGHILNSTDTFAGTGENSANIRAELLGGLATLISAKEYEGAVRVRYEADNDLDVIAFGFSGSDRIRVVIGEDGLRCAVQGNIEGANCSDPNNTPTQDVRFPCLPAEAPSLECLTAVKLGSTGTPGTESTEKYGRTTYARGTRANLAASGFNIGQFIAAKTRIYLVRPKTPTSPELPGHFEVMVGLNLHTADTYHYLPIVPSVDARVDQVLAPNRAFCSAPEVSCAGVRMDARLPLEDELTDDGDGVENSWKHYLTLARQAADEADLYGREYVNNALNLTNAQAQLEVRKEEQQQQAEALLQEVQDLCGTAIDSRTLLNSLSTTTSGNLGGMFLNSPTCPPGYRRTLGTGCILDLEKLLDKLPDSPDAKRLTECLTGANEPFITLGETPLCLSYRASNPDDVCPSNTGWEKCPVRKDGASCPPISDTTVTPAEATALKYFTDPGATPVTGACAAFRRARTGHNREDIMAIIMSNALHPQHLREYITELRWDAKYGGYAGISMADVERYASGDLTYGNRPGWPCSASPGCSPNSAAGFFCQAANCASDSERGKFNYRMLRATAAANLILGLHGEHGMKAMLPSRPVFPDGVALGGSAHTGDPCSKSNLSVVEAPADWFRGDEDDHFFGYTMSSDRVWDGATPIQHCQARLFLTTHLDADAPVGRDGYSSYERETTQPGTAWVTGDGSVVSSQLGERFALKSAFLSIHSWIPKDKIESLFLGYLSQAPFDYSQFWTRRVLEGHQSADTIVLNDIPALPFTFTIYNPSDPSPLSDYYLPGTTTLSGEDLLDGVELLCELAVNHHAAQTTLSPVVSASLESVEVAGHLVEQLSQNIVNQASSTVFARVPKVALDALRETSAVGAFPALGGQMAQAVSDLRLALLTTRESLPVVSGAMRQLSAEMKAYRAQVEIAQLQEQSIDLSLLSSTLDRFTNCAKSIAGIGIDPTRAAASGAIAGIECANAAAQIAIAMNASLVEKRIVDANLEVTRQSFISRVSQLATNIETASVGLSEAFESIDRSLAGIESLRKSAKNTIARALYIASNQSAKQVDYVKGLGTVASAYQARYKRALDNAKLMTFFAKRAIEQRLGINLSEMRDDLPLVDAPATWEGTLCTSVTDLGSLELEGPDHKNYKSYVGGAIGEYVTKLENLVESYRVEHNFHEGHDTAVISLRDDILNVRAPCSTKGRNLFAGSGRFGHGPWRPRGCRTVTINGEAHSTYNCVSARPLGEPALKGLINPINGAMGYRLQFGDGTSSCPNTPETTCGFQSGAALAQTLKLAPGRYRFSWYTKEANLAGGSNNAIAVVRPLPNSGLVTLLTFSSEPPVSTGAWHRVWQDFRIEEDNGFAGEYEVGFTAAGPLTDTVTVAAPMLEGLPNDNTAVILGSFQNTDADGNVRLAVCEDTTGEYFRADHWRRECVHLCDAGFSGNCTNGPEYCYHELSFGVAQRWIESGKLFNFSGFARGNFNYRIESVALNFVGSDVRNCEDSDTPSTCHSGGFVPYSIEHNGPFFVRTHDGRDFRAYVFDGRIEHARGLAAERYLTNPLSSTDRDLLSDYMRPELQGRPLDGNFTVRVWDEPGVNISAIQDIQLVLKYKYWTRFE